MLVPRQKMSHSRGSVPLGKLKRKDAILKWSVPSTKRFEKVSLRTSWGIDKKDRIFILFIPSMKRLTKKHYIKISLSQVVSVYISIFVTSLKTSRVTLKIDENTSVYKKK